MYGLLYGNNSSPAATTTTTTTAHFHSPPSSFLLCKFHLSVRLWTTTCSSTRRIYAPIARIYPASIPTGTNAASAK